MKRAAEQALGADSPSAGFFIKLRGRAAQAQRYAATMRICCHTKRPEEHFHDIAKNFAEEN
jgi:hypothetical protein